MGSTKHKKMKKGEIKNVTKFRLTGTPEGNLLVTFFELDIFDHEAVNWHLAERFVSQKVVNAGVVYEGNLSNLTHYQEAIHNLLKRVNVYVNCVRIEQESRK